MSTKSIKLPKQLLERAQQHATKIGYSSLEEFVQHVLERELATTEPQDADPELLKRFKGLGYVE